MSIKNPCKGDRKSVKRPPSQLDKINNPFQKK